MPVVEVKLYDDQDREVTTPGDGPQDGLVFASDRSFIFEGALMNSAEMPATLNDAIATEPTWLQVWLFVLGVANLAAAISGRLASCRRSLRRRSRAG
mgnify:CR=1 FL=1